MRERRRHPLPKAAIPKGWKDIRKNAPAEADGLMTKLSPDAAELSQAAARSGRTAHLPRILMSI